jgi:hypothetical protein
MQEYTGYLTWVYSCITLATLCTIWAVGICSYPDLSVFLHDIGYFVYNLSCKNQQLKLYTK